MASKKAPINLDSLPHHTKAGAEATKRAKERSKRLAGRLLSPRAAVVARQPFMQSHAAFADLTAVMGYPPAVIPAIKPSRSHRIVQADEEGEE